MKKYKFLILTVIVVLIYNVGMIRWSMIKGHSNAPTITFDSNIVTMSVQDDESKLLEGVKVTDIEDGNISKDVIIENLTAFVGDNTRIVNYIVFDSDDNITRASRSVKYTDYTAPVFALKDHLVGTKYSTTDLVDKLSAISSVDGDISSKIAIMNVAVKDNSTLNVRLSVSDSTNTTTYLNVKYYLENEKEIDIKLKKYLVYKGVGEVFDFRANISKIIERMNVDNSLKPFVKIQIPDMSMPGVYEVVYTLERQNGNSGKSIMIVVVE